MARKRQCASKGKSEGRKRNAAMFLLELMKRRDLSLLTLNGDGKCDSQSCKKEKGAERTSHSKTTHKRRIGRQKKRKYGESRCIKKFFTGESHENSILDFPKAPD